MATEQNRHHKETIAQYRSLLRVARPYLDAPEYKLVRKAFHMADQACRQMPAKQAQTELIRVIRIAQILIKEMGAGMVAAIGGLLLNVYADPGVKPAQIKKEFGAQVQLIVDGLHKISALDTRKTFAQPENLRKLMLSLASDMRVILVKLAEKLCDMRHLEDYPLEERIYLATESLYVYAPLAHRLGLYNIKTELEDLHMKFMEPQHYASIEKQVQETAAEREQFIARFIRPIRMRLRNQGFRFRILSRTKSIYSIWSKMKAQGLGFEEVYDLFAIRIILKTEPEQEKAACWQAYSLVTDYYQPNPQRLRDWISVPKSNGYESLHITVLGPGKRWVEVQIRSERMDGVAEKGLASHWKYKGGKQEKGIDEWLSAVRRLLESPDPGAGDYLDQLKLSLYTDEVFVFTPRGELRRLPSGSSLLDFAYDIHTEVGYRCTGARVNQKNVPLKYVLQNGDQVEVLTSNAQKPKRDWLNMVITTKARTKIRQALNEEKVKAAEAGKELLQRRLRNWKIAYNDENVKRLLHHFRLKTSQDLYALIFQEKIDLAEIKEVFIQPQSPEKKPAPDTETSIRSADIPGTVKEGAEDFLVVNENVDRLKFQLARCCHPIFGDEIFGFVTVNEGIKIHRLNCPNASQMISRYGYRVVKATWKKTFQTSSFQTVIRVTGIDELGMISKITEVISKDLKVNMRSISMESKDGFFEGIITLFVTSTSHLDGLLHRLIKIKGVQRAVRVEEFEG